MRYSDDCIHLKACRRLCRLAEAQTGEILTRGCNERCTAYQTEHAFINDSEQAFTSAEVRTCIRGAMRDAREGYSAEDVMIHDYLPHRVNY